MLERMRSRLLLTTGALLLTLSACGGGDEPAPDPQHKDGASNVAVVNPLTGIKLAKAPKNPVFVVKIDNTPPSAPQTEIDKADLVVEQLVEGGATRLAALYYSKLPENVGHVRSMRATDIGIAKPVNGQIVASGGAGVTISRIKSAGIPIHSEDGGSPGLSRGPGYAPYNVLANLKTVNEEAVNTPPAHAYFQWAAANATTPTGTKASNVSVPFSRSHTTTFSFQNGTWKRTNGTSEKEFAAKNLVVLWADEQDAGYTDPAGSPVPETVFDGTGKAVVFVGKNRIDGTWKKAGKGATIVLTAKDGTEFKLPAGSTWIELLSKSQAGELTVN
ncbi:MAG TPA: DUF3048 domain-containing protein [Aeromicrobium sp.]|nr:DUF3048 domain-containing protein [Aeromicrobium sp.]